VNRSRSKKQSPSDVHQTFPNRYHPNIIQGLNSQNNSQHKSLNSRDCYFSADIAQVFFQTLADNIFLWYRLLFLCGVAVKIYNVGRLGFFVRAQSKLRFGRHRHVFIYSARKTLAHLGKKHDSPILIGRNVSRRRPGKMTGRCLKKNHHRMTPIEHFLIDIIQILFRDWIENTIADIGRCKTATDIFQPTLRNFVYQRRPIIFLYGRGFFFVGCCRKNLQCRSATFFRSSSTEVMLRPTPACFHLIGKENISQPRQKNMIHRYWSKKMLADVGLERWPIDF